MNKFDDMMSLLQKESPEFTQLVAVDKKFVLFSRAWCVAELVEASLSCIPQNVQIFSHRQFDIKSADLDLYKKLARLTVSECEASRPEDKEAILARIPDLSEFDAHLQAWAAGKAVRWFRPHRRRGPHRPAVRGAALRRAEQEVALAVCRPSHSSFNALALDAMTSPGNLPLRSNGEGWRRQDDKAVVVLGGRWRLLLTLGALFARFPSVLVHSSAVRHAVASRREVKGPSCG